MEVPLLRIIRDTFTQHSTTGTLYLPDKYGKTFFTLEPVVRAVKIQNETAIPEGVYPLKWRYSPKLQTVVPWLQSVPDFEWVYLHWGNEAKDTDGCVLIGYDRKPDWVSNSRAAWQDMMDIIHPWIDAGNCQIQVSSKTGGRGV